MKKVYEAPSVEKIKFNYRDQVVAASAGDGTETTSNGYNSSACNAIDQIIGWLFDFSGSSLCS